MVSDTKLRTLSLFSGIGGIERGLKQTGITRTVCYVEIDPYAVGVLVKNMAKGYLDAAPVWDDVTTFGRTELDRIGSIDLIAGGFPCQDISVAGKGEGIVHGNRSGLFYEIIRTIRLAQPRYIFLENVPALLARGMDTVLRELSESGYDATWQTLSAAEVGANHKRERVWILANSRHLCGRDQEQGVYGKGNANQSRPDQVAGPGEDVAHAERISEERQKPENGSGGRTVLGSDGRGKDVSKTQESGLEGPDPAGDSRPTGFAGQSGQWQGKADWWATEPDVGRVVDGIPFRVDRLRCLGNAVVPQCVEYLFKEQNNE